MFEQLMTTIKSEVASGEFRAATARNVRRMLAAAQTNAKDFETPNSESESPASAVTEQPVSSAKPAAPVSAKDAFAALMGVSPDRVRTSSQPGAAQGMPGAPVRSSAPTAGRNDPCPCGSGKKYKKCCGQNLF
jgi:preprotein translocase subunit SecA